MTARPPRASTKSDTRRGKPRGATQSERERPERNDRGDRGERPERNDRPDRADRADKPRSSSVVPTDRYERIGDDDVLEVTDLPPAAGAAELQVPPRLRLLVLETAPHLASAQGAIVDAGHTVAVGAAGREAIDKLKFAIAEVDAILVGMPGGEPLIEAARALGDRRPVVIAAWTAGALEATRRAAIAGADLATVRPHHVERLAPILLAAGRLIEQRPAPGAMPPTPPLPAEHPIVPPIENPIEHDGADVDIELDLDDHEGEAEADPVGLLPAEQFAQAAQRALERARRDAEPLSVAMFVLDVPPPPPPAGLRGILRARAGNALVHALRDGDLATELHNDRFLVVMPRIDRTTSAEAARRIISAVAAGDPVNAAGRSFPPRVVGAVTSASEPEALDLPRLVGDVTQLLEQAQATGASLAVES